MYTTVHGICLTCMARLTWGTAGAGPVLAMCYIMWNCYDMLHDGAPPADARHRWCCNGC